jgi:hypothetical protein
MLETKLQDPPKFLIEAEPIEETLASFQEVEIAKEIIISAFKNEFLRVTLVNQGYAEYEPVVKNFFITLWFGERLYTLFDPETLKSLTEKLFNNPAVRDFVLNWTDTCAVLLSVSNFSIDRLIETISQGISLNKTVPELSDSHGNEKPVEESYNLINIRIRMKMHVEQQVVSDILKNNFWLTCIIVVYLYMSETASKDGFEIFG